VRISQGHCLMTREEILTYMLQQGWCVVPAEPYVPGDQKEYIGLKKDNYVYHLNVIQFTCKDLLQAIELEGVYRSRL
jgi:hypothetical protein